MKRETDVPVESPMATSKQNDHRRMANDCGVDLNLVSDHSSMRTIASGSARYRVPPRSTMPGGISIGAGILARLAAMNTRTSRCSRPVGDVPRIRPRYARWRCRASRVKQSTPVVVSGT